MTEDEEILQGLDLLGDWLDAKGYTEEAGLCTRTMDKIILLKAIASKAIREQIPLGEEIKSLSAENEELKRLNGNCDRHIKEVHAAYILEHVGLRAENEKLRAAIFEKETVMQIRAAAAAALKETGDE